MAESLKRGTRVTGADRSKLVADLKSRYEAGESIRSLAASTGRSYGFVHRILSESGVKLRGRSGATRGRAPKRISAMAGGSYVDEVEQGVRQSTTRRKFATTGCIPDGPYDLGKEHEKYLREHFGDYR